MQTRNVSRPARGQTRRLTITAAKAGLKYFNGQMLATDANGLAVPLTDAAGLKFRGVVIEPLLPDESQGYKRGFHLDNTLGTDGIVRGDQDVSERFVRSDVGFRYAFNFTGPTPKPGQDAYAVDDETFTVDAASTTHNLRIGEVDRLGPEGLYFLDFMR